MSYWAVWNWHWILFLQSTVTFNELLPWACQQPRCVSEPCPRTLSAGRSAGPSYITDLPARSAGSPSHGLPGNASLPSVHWGRATTTTTEAEDRGQKTTSDDHAKISKMTWWWVKLLRRVCVPVLNVFPNNKKVRLDESLDDLTVPLLPSRQLPGYWNRLPM